MRLRTPRARTLAGLLSVMEAEFSLTTLLSARAPDHDLQRQTDEELVPVRRGPAGGRFLVIARSTQRSEQAVRHLLSPWP